MKYRHLSLIAAAVLIMPSFVVAGVHQLSKAELANIRAGYSPNGICQDNGPCGLSNTTSYPCPTESINQQPTGNMPGTMGVVCTDSGICKIVNTAGADDQKCLGNGGNGCTGGSANNCYTWNNWTCQTNSHTQIIGLQVWMFPTCDCVSGTPKTGGQINTCQPEAGSGGNA